MDEDFSSGDFWEQPNRARLIQRAEKQGPEVME
jgi:hypothetical protein